MCLYLTATDSEQNPQNTKLLDFIDDKMYRLQLNEANCPLDTDSFPPFSTVPRGGQSEGVWESNHERQSLELSAEIVIGLSTCVSSDERNVDPQST